MTKHRWTLRELRKELWLVPAIWALDLLCFVIERAEKNGLDKPKIHQGIMLVAQAIAEDADDDLRQRGKLVP